MPIRFGTNGTGNRLVITSTGNAEFSGAATFGGATVVAGNNLTLNGSAYIYSDSANSVQTLKRQSGNNASNDYLQCRDASNGLDIQFSPGGNAMFAGSGKFDGHVGIGQAVVSDNQLRVTSDSVYNIVAKSARSGGATTDHNFTGLSGTTITSSILARGTTSIHHLYDNRDDAALNVGYHTASNNATKRTAAFFTAKGTLYLGDNGDTTTCLLYTSPSPRD